MSDKEDKFVNVADLKRKLRYWSKSRGASKQSVESLMETIGRIPYSVKAELETTLEAEQENHAHWEINPDGYYPYCSNCKTEPKGREMTDYCPNCGAKMKGSDTNA